MGGIKNIQKKCSYKVNIHKPKGLIVFSILATPRNVNAKFPLAFKTNKQVYCIAMYKHAIIKTILVI